MLTKSGNSLEISNLPATSMDALLNRGRAAGLPDFNIHYLACAEVDHKPAAGPRQGSYCSVFPSVQVGVWGYVFITAGFGESYVLLTLQERVVQGKRTLVAEPPIGYAHLPRSGLDTTPHSVQQFAEHLNAKQLAQMQAATPKLRTQVLRQSYLQARRAYTEGKLAQHYQVDGSIQQAVKRAISEKTNLPTQYLQPIIGTLWHENIGPKHLIHYNRFNFYLPHTTLPELPPLAPESRVRRAFWCPIKAIKFSKQGNIDQATIVLEGKPYPVKPYEGHAEMLRCAILHFKVHRVEQLLQQKLEASQKLLPCAVARPTELQTTLSQVVTLNQRYKTARQRAQAATQHATVASQVTPPNPKLR